MEIKKMWLVEASLAIKEIVAMYDEVKDIVYCYVYKDDFNEESPRSIGEWYPPYNHETFYKTEGAAIDYRNAKREEFKEMMPKVKAFIERMENVESTDDFKFEKEDYLGDYASGRDNWWERQYDEMKAKYRRIMLVVKNGMMNINADSFKLAEVVRVEWNNVKYMKDGKQKTKEAATVVLKDGRKIRTRHEAEYEVVKAFFGENLSNRIYNVKEESEDE